MRLSYAKMPVLFLFLSLSPNIAIASGIWNNIDLLSLSVNIDSSVDEGSSGSLAVVVVAAG